MVKTLNFSKMQALGNDFMVIDTFKQTSPSGTSASNVSLSKQDVDKILNDALKNRKIGIEDLSAEIKAYLTDDEQRASFKRVVELFVDVDKKFDKQLMKLLTIYRNSKLSTIICSQAVQIMNATGRTNINHIFLFKLNFC